MDSKYWDLIAEAHRKRDLQPCSKETALETLEICPEQVEAQEDGMDLDA